MKKIFIAVTVFSFAISLSAQNNQKPCSAAEASQFDFWVGEWKLFSGDSSAGTNVVHKIMDGCTVQENFSNPATGYQGKSWSVYNPQSKQWQQTWVDNQGGYIDLTGKFENGNMTLFTQPRKLPNGKEQLFRMLYSNIKNDSLDWDWDVSTDVGITWKSVWKIRYVRK